MVILVPLGVVLVPAVLITVADGGVAVAIASSASVIVSKVTDPKSKKNASLVPTGKILVS